MKDFKITRRSFLAGTAVTLAAGCATTKKGKAPGKISVKSPNEMVNFAGIGCGGKGASDVQGALEAGCNLIAMCDVDSNNAAKLYNLHPNVPQYQDYRIMLEKHKDIDAVNVSTPDHMHAMIAIHAEILAIESGKADPANNPLKHAPHPADVVCADRWDRPYGREQAAYPVPGLREFKFWPAVGRVDNVFGDRNLVCSCVGMEAYGA